EHDIGTGETTSRSVPMLRRFAAFNADQADGLSARFHPEPRAERPIARPQALLDGHLDQPRAPQLIHDVHDQPSYNPAADEIHLPTLTGHRSAEHYCAAALHGAAHSTGHATRLSWTGVTSQAATIGSHEYGPEELVAQMSA